MLLSSFLIPFALGSAGGSSLLSKALARPGCGGSDSSLAPSSSTVPSTRSAVTYLSDPLRAQWAAYEVVEPARVGVRDVAELAEVARGLLR